MLLQFRDRVSDCSFIERVWSCVSEAEGHFLSVASSHWEIVVTRLRGTTSVTLRGPETSVRKLVCPAGAEWLGIRFKIGTFMPRCPVSRLIDGQDVAIVSVDHRMFRLNGEAWEIPTFENAEAFVVRLIQRGVVTREDAVPAIVDGRREAFSQRTGQRRFLSATGMTLSTFRQIERARFATNLLLKGLSIADTVHEAAYFDQPHLTRALRSLIGQTPGQVVTGGEQLSFLCNTTTRS